MNNTNLQEYTKLKVEVIEVLDSIEKIIHVYTPHLGKVIIESGKNITTGVLFFGSVRRDKKTPLEIISKIVTLEDESKNYLLDNWLKENK